MKSTAWEPRVHKLKKICSHYFWAFQLPVVDHAKDHSPTHPNVQCTSTSWQRRLYQPLHKPETWKKTLKTWTPGPLDSERRCYPRERPRSWHPRLRIQKQVLLLKKAFRNKAAYQWRRKDSTNQLMQNKAIRQKCCCSNFKQSLLQAWCGLGIPVDWALRRYLYTVYLPPNIDKIIHITTLNEGVLALTASTRP